MEKEGQNMNLAWVVTCDFKEEFCCVVSFSDMPVSEYPTQSCRPSGRDCDGGPGDGHGS